MTPGVEELIETTGRSAGEHPDSDNYRKVMVADKRVMVRLIRVGMECSADSQ